MRKTLTISVPEPCHENWNLMTPVEQGRHCAACNKTVHDFTSQSDEQIINRYQHDHKLCGRFSSSQLQRPMVLQRGESSRFKTLLASGFFSFLMFGSQEILAQEKPSVVQIDTIPNILGKPAISVLRNQEVTGTVLDENGLPLPGANIVIKGTAQGTQTDFDGNFKLGVKADDTLVLSYIGYITKEIKISETDLIKMKLDVSMDYCDVIVTGKILVSEESQRTKAGKLLHNLTQIFRKQE